MADSEHDIIIIGAGISGINTAHVLRKEMPHRNYTILEGRPILGGTWSFFRYPGFRSDSPLSTFGFKWHPWKHKHMIAEGHEIVEYVKEAALADGSWDKIQYNHKVLSCDWSGQEQKWTLDVDVAGTRKLIKANFVISCTGYYSYSKALEAKIPGIEKFGGHVVHPQWWPEDLDYKDKKVVVIGSGATAVTIVPTLAKTAAQVTQLQRSPSYVVARPNHSPLRTILRWFLPLALVHTITWWVDTVFELGFSQFCLAFPRIARLLITIVMRRDMPRGVDVKTHFNPRYSPFQQRLCLCPNGDFFKALNQDNCDIVTDVIDTVTQDGILLQSGQKLEADIIVTATGLYFETFGGTTAKVDGKVIDPGALYTWRGCMLESLPNMGFIMGYVTQSWTPGALVMAETVIRILKSMERRGATQVTPVIKRWKDMPAYLAVDAKSNYFIKAADRIPKTTGQTPWYGRVNIFVDAWALWFGKLDEGLVYGGESKKTQ